MKQILLLLLLPCFAMAQYPGNANQKITLGEQTTADGLVYRGVENDTANITPLSDTSAYIILDTVNNKFYNYNRSTNVWSLAGGGVSVSSFSAGTTGLTPNTATTGAVTLGGTLAVANGGTGTGTAFKAGSIVFAGTNGTYAQDTTNLIFDNTTKRLNIGVGSNVGTGKQGVVSPMVIQGDTDGKVFSAIARRSGNLITYFFYQNNADSLMAGFTFRSTRHSIDSYNKMPIQFFIGEFHNSQPLEKMRLTYEGRLGIGITAPSEALHVVGNARISGLAATGTRPVVADVNGVLSAPVSSINFKENVQPLNYGLNEILQINPISFDYIDKNKWGEDRNLGFIVEDIFPIIPEVTGTLENDAMYLDMTKLIPILTKAIQEQQALIKALEQRILILENK